MTPPMDLKLLVLDVDGVMTDGSIHIDHAGNEIKRFYVRDGLAIRVWQHAGFTVGIITARSSPAVAYRAADLGIEMVEQAAKNKGRSLREFCGRLGITLEQAAYIGDDLADLGAMTLAGYPIAPADAAAEIKAAAKFVTQAPGGRGAVREAVEHMLKAMGKWESVLERYRQMV